MKVHLRFIKLLMNPRDKGICTEFEQKKRAAHFQANQEDAIRLLKKKFKGKPGQYVLSSALSQNELQSLQLIEQEVGNSSVKQIKILRKRSFTGVGFLIFLFSPWRDRSFS